MGMCDVLTRGLCTSFYFSSHHHCHPPCDHITKKTRHRIPSPITSNSCTRPCRSAGSATASSRSQTTGGTTCPRRRNGSSGRSATNSRTSSPPRAEGSGRLVALRPPPTRATGLRTARPRAPTSRQPGAGPPVQRLLLLGQGHWLARPHACSRRFACLPTQGGRRKGRKPNGFDLLGKTELGGKVSPLACPREMAAKGVTLIRMLCRGYVAHASQDNKDANDTFAVQVV